MSQLVLDLIPTIARQCITEEYEICRDDHVIHRMLPAILEIERQLQLLGMGAAIDQVMSEARELAAKCLRFELVFESSVTVQSPFGGESRSEVEARVQITFVPDSAGLGVLRGEAPLNNNAYDPGDFPGCTITGVPGGGTFTVGSLSWDASMHDPTNELGTLNDIHLRYSPGETTESDNMNCPTGAGHTESPLWSPTYGGMHADEMSEDFSSAEGLGFGGVEEFLAIGWEILGGDIYATREWTHSQSGSAGRAGSAQEEGRFVLFHHPQ
jgi:hypothetical protein